MKSMNSFFLLLLIVLASCTDSGRPKNADLSSDSTQQYPEESIDNSVLHLNKGKKWHVNDATHEGMTNIQNLLIEFINNDKKDYVSLAASMSSEASTLISKCDMVGIEHDQLHLILHPILESIDAIKQNGSMETLKTLSEQLNTYFNHFQRAK